MEPCQTIKSETEGRRRDASPPSMGFGGMSGYLSQVQSMGSNLPGAVTRKRAV